MIDGICGFILLIIWVFGIIFVTFGDPSTSPGANVGNLYFFTWGSFLVAVYVTADSIGRIVPHFGEGKDTVAHHDESSHKEEGDVAKKDEEEGGDKVEG